MTEINYALFASDKSIRDVMYEILKDAIISGDILPGEHIVESAYAKRYNISRTPIREALRKLEQDGLVEYRARKGVIVRSLEEEDIREIYVIRQALEDLALQYAVKNVTEEDIQTLYAILDETATFIRVGDIGSASKNSRQIHVYIYRLSGLSRLQTLIGSLNEYMDRFSFMTLSDHDRQAQSAKEHRAMVDALKERDMEKLISISHDHLLRAQKKCIEGYKERKRLAEKN